MVTHSSKATIVNTFEMNFLRMALLENELSKLDKGWSNTLVSIFGQYKISKVLKLIKRKLFTLLLLLTSLTNQLNFSQIMSHRSSKIKWSFSDLLMDYVDILVF